MATPIHPDAQRTYRARKCWTQEQLAEATRGVSLPTIKRIESTKNGTYSAQDRVAEMLAKALGQSVEDLSKAPTKGEAGEETLRSMGFRPLRTMVDGETALAFNMVQHIYGISVRSQIEMAPLFAALLAEGSLIWRRKRVAAIEEAYAKLQELGGGHCSFVYAAGRVDEGSAKERESIAKRDLFGVHVSEHAFECGYDSSLNNPFADFLGTLACETETPTITLEKKFGGWTGGGLPHYRIGADIIERLTGGNLDAEYALLRGHVRLKDIPEELRGAEKEAERVAWMIERIPGEERTARLTEQNELLALFDVEEEGTHTPSQEVPEVNSNA